MAESRIPVKMNHLCCPICCEVLRNPATIPCGHNFCMRCIQERWGHHQRSDSSCSCPECGCVFPFRPQLIKNTTLADLVRDTERCDAGSERSSTETGNPSCWRHGSSLDVYCCTDEQIICAVCASAEHMGHTIGSVRGERKRKQVIGNCMSALSEKTDNNSFCAVIQYLYLKGSHKEAHKDEQATLEEEELKDMQKKSKQILQKQEKEWKKLGKTLEEMQGEARKTEDYCESVLVKVIDTIQRRYLSVKEMIAAQEEVAAAQVQSSMQTLQVKMEKTRRRSDELELLAQTDNNVHFLERWPCLRCLCEKDHRHALHEVSKDPLLPFELTKRAVEELGRQLEEFCDKEFTSICQTTESGEQQESGEKTEEDDMQQRCDASTSQAHGLPGFNNTLTEQAVGPKTRAEFLQFACCLSLDPTTAHQDLAISVGDKEVKLSSLKCKSSAIRYPERFIHRRQVLCREGLQSERCYYEVEVEGDVAEIALAYKQIDRKSRTRLSAFGGNENSWSLDRSTSYSVSHRSNSILLTSAPSHHRIGVYLEFKKGALSFYEVSDTMKFLYKVEAVFAEPLYPGFWLGDKCCIRICDLK